MFNFNKHDFLKWMVFIKKPSIFHYKPIDNAKHNYDKPIDNDKPTDNSMA